MSRHPTLGVLAIAAFAALCAALSASPASAQSKPCDCLDQFSPNLAVEAGFFSPGSFDFSATTIPSGKLQSQTKVQGLILDLVVTMPMDTPPSDPARAGGHHTRTRSGYTGSRAADPFHNTPSDRRCHLNLGVGLQYAVGPAILAPGEVERYRDSDAVDGPDHANALGAMFPLGRLSFSADPRFGSVPSTVRPDSMAGLDTFARELQGAHDDTITVAGPTDRLDTPAYNQKLALHRTEAVKAYLASHNGLSASKISAVGKAETPPMTEFEDCMGYRAALVSISCLQAPRRVDAEVTGTC